MQRRERDVNGPARPTACPKRNENGMMERYDICFDPEMLGSSEPEARPSINAESSHPFFSGGDIKINPWTRARALSERGFGTGEIFNPRLILRLYRNNELLLSHPPLSTCILNVKIALSFESQRLPSIVSFHPQRVHLDCFCQRRVLSAVF